MVDAGLVALRDFGTKSFAEVIGPAIELADGYAIDEHARRIHRALAGSSSNCGPIQSDIGCRTARCRMPGEIFRQPEPRRTLRAMVDGREESAAQPARSVKPPSTRFAIISIAATSPTASMRSCKANDGLLRYEDMAAFKLCNRKNPSPPLIAATSVYKPGFWSQGPAMIEALNMLEGYRHAHPRHQFRRVYSSPWWKPSSSPTPIATPITAIRSSTRFPPTFCYPRSTPPSGAS